MLIVPIVNGEAIIEIAVSQSPAQTEYFKYPSSFNAPVISARALVDTGASHSCISIDLAQRLELMQIGSLELSTASSSHSPLACVQYLGQLSIPMAHQEFTLAAISLAGLDLSSQGIEALLGMDVLTRLHMRLDGPARLLTLSTNPIGNK